MKRNEDAWLATRKTNIFLGPGVSCDKRVNHIQLVRYANKAGDADENYTN